MKNIKIEYKLDEEKFKKSIEVDLKSFEEIEKKYEKFDGLPRLLEKISLEETIENIEDRIKYDTNKLIYSAECRISEIEQENHVYFDKGGEIERNFMANCHKYEEYFYFHLYDEQYSHSYKVPKPCRKYNSTAVVDHNVYNHITQKIIYGTKKPPQIILTAENYEKSRKITVEKTIKSMVEEQKNILSALDDNSRTVILEYLNKEYFVSKKGNIIFKNWHGKINHEMTKWVKENKFLGIMQKARIDENWKRIE